VKKVRYLLPTAAATSLLVLSLGCASGPKVGSRAPSFEAVDDAGHDVSLAGYEGKVVVMYFWATWCAPCAVSGPAVQKLHARYSQNADVVVVGVHYDNKGDPAAHNEKNGYTFEIIPDGREVVARYGIKKIPSFVIVGADGVVLRSQVGYSGGDEQEFERIIDTHLDANNRVSQGAS
jgi:peroxiredoxin